MAEAWQQRRYSAHWLVDCCGRHLRVVFPGRRWGGPGPDFRGAVLALSDGTLVRGDVEIHVRASSWMSHGHARDPAYQQVVLHVVAVADAMAVDVLGEHVPVVELEPWHEPPGRLRFARLGQLAVLSAVDRGPCVRAAPQVLSIVRAAGRERFRTRAARFEADLRTVAADQVVWRGVCEALGFRRNVAPFGQLAEAVPWTEAARVVVERGPVGLAGLLLGTAGLLAEATLAEAHAFRALERRAVARQVLARSAWDRRELRAGNAPAERCRGLAMLTQRCVGQWPDAGPARQVEDAVRAAAGSRWPRLWSLVHAPPWIGRGRAQVVVVNVLLPFAAAVGVGEAAALFERLPGEPSNHIVRYMAEQLGGRGPGARADQVARPRLHGACVQQGLLHLFAQTCAARACEECPARGPTKPGATIEPRGSSSP